MAITRRRFVGGGLATGAALMGGAVSPFSRLGAATEELASCPNISIPVGLTPEGKPAGIWMYSGFLREPRLLALAYDLEQELQPRRHPEMLSAVPPEPPDAGICASLPRPQIGGKAHLPHHIGTGKPFRF